MVHRSDGSGTTYIWTDYLSKISPEWQQKVGKATSVNWPVGLGGKGQRGRGRAGPTDAGLAWLRRVDLCDPEQHAYGKVKNSSGAFVKADLASVSAAAAAAAKYMPDDFRVSITNPEGKAAYPIASFTWLLIPSKFTDSAKRDVVKDFLKWMMTDGQQYCEGLGVRETAEGSCRQGNESDRADSVNVGTREGEHNEMATTPNAATPADSL